MEEFPEAGQDGSVDVGSRRTADRPQLDGVNGEDAAEVAFLDRHRAAMDNDELRAFLDGESAFHDAVETAGGWTPFSDREERLLLRQHEDGPEELAEALGRDAAAVEAKLRAMGLLDAPGETAGPYRHAELDPVELASDLLDDEE